MFASWSAGEYGNVGATEWLEVRLAFQRTILSDCAALQMLSNVCVLELYVHESECFDLHQPGRSCHG